MKIQPIIKTKGSKWQSREFIISSFPENYDQMTYIEPFCSSASIFLNKTPSQTEVLSDTDEGLICILKCLRDESKEFISRIKRTKCSERAFKIALNKSQSEFDDYFEKGINEYILRKMSRNGLKKKFACSEKFMDESENAWEEELEKLHETSERIKNSIILCKDFVDVIKAWDEEGTLFYLDPPTLRSVGLEESPEPYELSVEDHMNLINLAKNARAKVVISGHSCPLYNRSFKNWKCKKNPTSANKTKSKDNKIECIWYNY